MNWEAIGAIGEFVGALAVFGTLVYLALQMKQVRSEIHLGSLRNANQQFGNIYNSVSASPELAKLLIKADADEPSLTPWEMTMLDNHFNAHMAGYETLFEQVDTGALKISLEEIERIMAAFFEAPWVPGAWERTKKIYLEEFRERIERITPHNSNSGSTQAKPSV